MDSPMLTLNASTMVEWAALLLHIVTGRQNVGTAKLVEEGALLGTRVSMVMHRRNRAEFLVGWTRSHTLLELEFLLRPTVSRPVRLGIGPPFGTLDQILSCSSYFVWQLLFSSFKGAFSDEKQVCSLQCNHSLVRLLTPNNHTVPSHLRLCSLFVASYDLQGLWWKYSNPPPHRGHTLRV
jgi:hypothetical protein